ncbi:SPW repeat-containing protein [Amycolatopsis arida]|uniref:SPW repeat-containing protein n=1 Tax=Amycolatopsis arida TaxID=587909 RepID=A0A1I5ZR80_9PSEU|nr:SPW repeat protein [Amycolatopsis arida]TDX89305.1 SPW repeat-containing protein [Amycolatopsis arida]SFQ58948.1 SPW repeat-containing protein [Amycolatopsis arida]
MNTHDRRDDDRATPLVPQEQYGPWKGMRPPYASPSAVPADRYARPARSYSFREVLAGFPNALAMLAGVWLVVSPWLLDHPGTAAGFNAAWNDILVGVLVFLVAGARAVSPYATLPWSWVPIVLGIWLVAAPYVLGFAAESRPVTVNDIVMGALIAVLTAVGVLTSLWGRRARTNAQPDARAEDA